MKYRVFLSALFAVALCNISVAQGVKELECWVEQNPASLELADEPFADKSLSAKDAQAVSSILESQWRSQMQQRHKEALEKETFKRGRLQMKFKAITYGEKPADGRSLYISMHGGGATHKRVNDQQWDIKSAFISQRRVFMLHLVLRGMIGICGLSQVWMSSSRC